MNPGGELDFDWTIAHGNKAKEFALREIRNKLIKGKLQNGHPVGYRSSGWSCWPAISSNDLCYYAPVYKRELWYWDQRHRICYNDLGYWRQQDWISLKKGDLVFCAVEPGGRYFAHPIHEIKWSWHGGAQHPCYTIANLKGHVNGVSYEDMIWGILYQVNDKPFTGVEF